MDSLLVEELVPCGNCGESIIIDSNFCTSCGQPQHKITPHNNELKIGLTYFFAILLLNASIYWFVNDYSFESEVITSMIFILITTGYILYFRKTIQHLLDFTSLKPAIILLSIIAAIVLSISVYFFADWVNLTLWEETTWSIETYILTNLPLLNAIIFTCVIPAIFEEFAFRGFLYGLVEKEVNGQTALVITSILFAILHLSVIGLIWYIPLGFILGYFRKKYDSLVYCMIMHFTYNLIIILLDFNYFYS